MSAREPGIEEHLTCHSERSEEPLTSPVDRSKQNAPRIMRRDRFGNRNWQSTIARSLVVCATRDDKLQRATEVLEAIQALFDYVYTGGVTEPDSAVVTEGSSRNDRDIGFAQQAIGEIL